ncbi:MAG: isoprenyl transferase [Chitinispirillaceae bacterium]|jgi:undecaprenyl diphosphate synthase|nr:isoprenyl transferase [Chitinispirillaceae bacterium]
MNTPRHIGIIMDGNGRWAKQRGLPRTAGHRAGIDAVRRVVQASGELGVKYLTIYTFSTENWARPKFEVTMLMELLVEVTRREIAELDKNNVRLRAIGDLEMLPKKTRKVLLDGIQQLSANTGLTLILALNYGGRAEIIHAATQFAEAARKDPSLIERLDENKFAQYLFTADIPDPELIIRTSGEYRISNFLLWQAAYSEFYITDTYWPDFDKECLIKAIEDYNSRDRRFGKVKES